MNVRVDQAGHDHQGPQVDGILGPLWYAGRRAHRADASGVVHLDDAVGLPQRLPVGEGTEQARPKRERRLLRDDD